MGIPVIIFPIATPIRNAIRILEKENAVSKQSQKKARK